MGEKARANQPVDNHWPKAHEVADILAESKGFWRSCSGCHESNEGYPTGPWSTVLGCNLGLGCHECGGIGAVWDTTDYADMGDYISHQDQLERALGKAAEKFEAIRIVLIDNLADPERKAFWIAVSARDDARAALSRHGEGK